jgi:hypothetical protein
MGRRQSCVRNKYGDPSNSSGAGDPKLCSEFLNSPSGLLGEDPMPFAGTSIITDTSRGPERVRSGLKIRVLLGEDNS